jgi:hypothetical protein
MTDNAWPCNSNLRTSHVPMQTPHVPMQTPAMETETGEKERGTERGGET